MTWLPTIVLFGSSVFPIGYYLSSGDRDEAGLSGAISVFVPLIGLLLGLVLIVSSLGSLIANPTQLLGAVIGIVEVFLVIGFLVPRVIGASVVEYIIN